MSSLIVSGFVKNNETVESTDTSFS